MILTLVGRVVGIHIRDDVLGENGEIDVLAILAAFLVTMETVGRRNI